MKNEELILLIQNEATSDSDREGYLTELYNNTEKAIYYLYHKYKNELIENEDLKSILSLGWTKAVLKYDTNKDNTSNSFVNFALYVMKAEYISYITKIKRKYYSNLLDAKCFMQDLFVDDIVNKDTVAIAMEHLKRRNYITYFVMKEYFYNNKTQLEIAKELNVAQSNVCKRIQNGKEYIKNIISI